MIDQGNMSVDLRIDRDLMEAFAAFSGDRSSLHMDPAFGRRSMFGGTVVHGMLPLMFLGILLPAGARISRVKGRFIEPILPGDPITLETAAEPSTHDEHNILFSVRRRGTVVTRGSLFFTVDGTERPEHTGPANCLLKAPIDESSHYFEAITLGSRSELEFELNGEQVFALNELLAMGSKGAEETPDPGALATMALLSTTVGMRMPGRTATFQEFDVTFLRALPNGVSTLAADVAFRSEATNTIKQDIRVLSNGRTVAQGKVSVKVAQAPFKAPTMEELVQRGTDFGLKDQVVLITGASRGIGATAAKLFALHGARVVIDHRASKAEAEAVSKEIQAHGGQAMVVQADVTDPEAVRRMVQQVEDTWGAIDVLVNNAAANFRPIPFLDTRWEDVQSDMDTIVQGAFNMAQAVIPGFIKNGGGRIVNLSTIAVENPPALQTKYVLAKSALTGLTRALAVEFAGQNIRVNMVVPSFVETDLTSGHSRVAVNQMKAGSPMKRLATAQDVAEAIVYLASPRSAYTTGQKLMVTGGLSPFH